MKAVNLRLARYESQNYVISHTCLSDMPQFLSNEFISH